MFWNAFKFVLGFGFGIIAFYVLIAILAYFLAFFGFL